MVPFTWRHASLDMGHWSRFRVENSGGHGLGYDVRFSYSNFSYHLVFKRVVRRGCVIKIEGGE